MAARGRNPPAQPALQGADPALVQILQMMQNRDANRDNSRKQFLMFPKESFTGQDKKLAKSHWAEFSKYLDYQDQQGTIPRDLAHLPEIKSMFKLTLQDIALGWFETESPTWLTEDQMKQSFLKRFNPWGCCDIGQIDRFSIIELFPLSSCQVIILITIMSFNCFSSCLMSKVSTGITINTSKCYERAQQCNDNSQFSSHS